MAISFSKTYFEVKLKYSYTSKMKCTRKEKLAMFRAQRANLNEWGVRARSTTKALAKKEYQKIPLKYRRNFEVIEGFDLYF